MENATPLDVPNTFGYSTNNDRILSKATAGAHAAVNSVAGAADGMARSATPAIDHVAAIAHEVVESTAASAAPVTGWVGEQRATLKAARTKLVSDTSGYITANPLKSVGAAVLAGLLISRMLRR